MRKTQFNVDQEGKSAGERSFPLPQEESRAYLASVQRSLYLSAPLGPGSALFSENLPPLEGNMALVALGLPHS